MQNKNWVTDAPKSENLFVYYYLLAGIALVVAVFLFLPKVAVG